MSVLKSLILIMAISLISCGSDSPTTSSVEKTTSSSSVHDLNSFCNRLKESDIRTTFGLTEDVVFKYTYNKKHHICTYTWDDENIRAEIEKKKAELHKTNKIQEAIRLVSKGSTYKISVNPNMFQQDTEVKAARIFAAQNKNLTEGYSVDSKNPTIGTVTVEGKKSYAVTGLGSEAVWDPARVQLRIRDGVNMFYVNSNPLMRDVLGQEETLTKLIAIARIVLK